MNLLEKASIDWNNYLTPEEVQKFLSKDDKVESAEEIVYDTKGNFYDKYFKDFKEQGWTKRELTQDLANFYHNGHLITENKLQENNAKLTLYHNTTNENAIKINKEGIKCGMRLSVYGKGSEAEGSGIWCSSVRGYGYGGATITFEIDEKDKDLVKQNDTEYIVYRDIAPDEIVDIDLVVSKIVINNLPSTVESTIPLAIKKYGKEKLYNVFKKYEHNFVEPYNMEQFKHLVETGEKYCKGKIQLTEGIHLYGFVKDEDGNAKIIEDSDYPDKKSFENDLRANGYKVNRVNDNKDMYIMDHSDYRSVNELKTKLAEINKNEKEGILLPTERVQRDIIEDLLKKVQKISLTENYKLEEASRNELLAKTKMQTLTRYRKANAYKGFSLDDVNTNSLLVYDTLPITCRVGKYWCTVELQDFLYWIQYEAEKNKDNQINSKAIINAIMEAVDAKDIKVSCTCPDSQYRFNYYLTQIGAKYGKPENRPAKITNPNNYGALCKHETAFLSNKKWMQQIAPILTDWCSKRINEINRYLKVKPGEELTLPNELARQNARLGQYAKMFDKEEKENEKKAEEGNNE